MTHTWIYWCFFLIFLLSLVNIWRRFSNILRNCVIAWLQINFSIIMSIKLMKPKMYQSWLFYYKPGLEFLLHLCKQTNQFWHMSHITCLMSHVNCHISPVTGHMSPVFNANSQSQRPFNWLSLQLCTVDLFAKTQKTMVSQKRQTPYRHCKPSCLLYRLAFSSAIFGQNIEAAYLPVSFEEI